MKDQLPSAVKPIEDTSNKKHQANSHAMDQSAKNIADVPQDAADGSLREKRGKLTREEEAKLALEHTEIPRPVAWAISVLFLLTIFSVPIIQYFLSGNRKPAVTAVQVDSSQGKGVLLPASEDGATLRSALSHIPTAQELKKIETQLENNSVVGQFLLPPAQNVLLRLGAGNEQVYVGRNNWLMYRPDVDYLTSRGFLDPARLKVRARSGGEDTPRIQPDPLAAILHFKEQLARRGIQLVLMPTPLKPMLYPEMLAARYASYNFAQPLQNPSYARFIRELQKHGVLVCDVTPQLQADKLRTAQYLATDTHWTPQGMGVAADALSAFVLQHVGLPANKATPYRSKTASLSHLGDIAHMLKLPAQSQRYRRQTVQIRQILTPGGKLWKASHDADVLLLGDSFSNIFSRQALGWGQAAGLAEQLSFKLQRPLDVIAINAGGASAARQRLRDELLRGQDRLKSKRLVIWQFAMRDLLNGDWKLLDLPSASTSRAAQTSPGNLLPEQPLRPLKITEVSPRFRSELIKRAANSEKTGSPVLPGEKGWMYYLSDVYYVAGKGFLRGQNDPRLVALIDFKRQLEKRGIQLLVVPVPGKPIIYPDNLGIDNEPLIKGDVAAVPQNPSFAAYRQALEQAGITVFDPTAAMLSARQRTLEPLFIPTDAHWSFAGMDVVASQLAELIKGQFALPEQESVAYTRRPAQVTNMTDLSIMHKRAVKTSDYVRQKLTVQRVYTPDGKLWTSSRNADILLLGDSFTNMYARGDRWGKAAGLAEQLSYHLQRPVERIAIDGGSRNEIREELRDRMLRGDDPLVGKKLVVYQFISRYLLLRKWKTIKLPAPRNTGRSSRGAFVAPTARPAAPASPVLIQGIVKTPAVVPQPGTVPYGDMLMTVRLTDTRILSKSRGGTRLPRDILVYVWAMRNQVLTPAANWRSGQTVTLQVLPWSQVEDEYGAYNRADLEGHDDLRLNIYWGQPRP